MKPVAIGTRVFELPGGSREFWEITLDGKATTVTFGRRGAGGRSESNDWASDADARENYEKQIAQQKEKGYVELTSTKAAAPWSPAVSRQLARLEIACQSFYRPRAPRPLGDFASFIRPGRQGWSDVDPEGEVTQAPPDRSRFLLSPMPGLLAEVAVRAGQEVKAGERLVVIEAMKMQNVILAERDAVVSELLAREGESLAVDQPVLAFK